ncbi:AAA domain-containing protein [Kriegella sp. EG-1]|nr:AAA domain-containing protein [Flavobacteriaceae bacterium EG-1]
MTDYQTTETVKEAIHIAQAVARENAHEHYSSAHLLKALLHKDIGLLSFIEDMEQDGYYAEEWAEVRLEGLPKTAKAPENPTGDASVEAVFYEADNIKLKLGLDDVNEFCLLIALCTPGVGFSYDQLKTLPLTPNEIIDFLESADASPNPSGNGKAILGNKNKTNTGLTNLNKYCTDKTAEAQNETIVNISGRDVELKMITEILGRHSKPNVLILGNPGVGKTVMFNALSYATINDNIPEHLKNTRVFELDFIHLVSGAGYKGEIEDRFQKVFNELKQFERPILLIDELKNLTDKNSGNQGLVNILKSELVKGEVTIIATATNDAFRKHIEVDEALARQFEKVSLFEPSEEEAYRMIKNSMSHFSNHHKLDLDSQTILEAIRLSKRYTKERSLPDSALDLIDRTMSAAKFMIETSASEISSLEERLKTMKEEKWEPQKSIAELNWLHTQIKDKLSYLLFTELGEEDSHFENITTPKEGFSKLSAVLKNLKTIADKEKKAIDKNDIASTMANKTGIPIGKLQADEKERLLHMEEQLQKRVIGQDHAIKIITEAVLESRSGLSKPGLPIGSFFFSGPTGTGKTELAKALALFLFQNENSIIRFDMSEFKEEHSAALLYGAPPGYVGYEEGGVLVNKIRQKPYSIVLLDEIEKAHPSVFDIFLQILDEGKLHDRLGKEGDFSNSVILFTSNIGSQHIVDTFGEGKIPKSSDLLEMMGNYFRPEFLGRLTEIIPFSPITEENIGKIFKIQLKDLYKALEKQEIDLEITEEAIAMLAMKGFTPKYGARPLRGVIRSDLRSPLSKMIISGKVKKGTKIKLKLDADNKLQWIIG